MSKTAYDTETKPMLNEDVELFREKDDYYAPSVHVTKHGWIGIKVGGTVYSMPIKEWHKLAEKHFAIKTIQGMTHEEPNN